MQGIDQNGPGLEVIKLEFILRLKIKRNDWLLADIELYFESETVLKFYTVTPRPGMRRYARL